MGKMTLKLGLNIQDILPPIFTFLLLYMKSLHTCEYVGVTTSLEGILIF